MAKRAMKDVFAAAGSADAEAKLNRAFQILDRIAARGIVHKNYAANHKSKLALYVRKHKVA